MCGICGWLSTERKIEVAIIKNMNNIARHRGPDDEGYAFISDQGIELFCGQDSRGSTLPLVSKERLNNIFLAFGHRRLSILDLSVKGHQPMCSADNQFCITFNGEIYNFVELRQELISKGYVFYSDSDTEVLLASYQEWGEDCVAHFNGMWGFAIWDAMQHKLFCSRDRLGAKPFYYYWDGKNFLFSSEIKQICQNPIVPRKMNASLLATEIFWRISDFSEESWLQDVNQLQGGQNLVLELPFSDEVVGANCRIYSYWDIDVAKEKDKASIDRAMQIYRDAVRIRTRSDVPVGVMLSGGLDSSTLVAEVSEYFQALGRNSSEIQTFTSCWKDFHEGDEREFAHLVNEHCGTTENLIYPDAQDTLSAWEKMIWHQEGTAGIGALGSFLMLREIQKTGVKVLLNGQGADESMFGYERYYAWYLKDILYKQGMGAFFQAWNLAAKNSKLSHVELLEYMVYFLCYSVRKTRNEWRMAKYASPLLGKLFRENDSIRRFISLRNMTEMQYNELRRTQLTWILHLDDRLYMAFSMESRVPFIDYRYIEEAVRIPEDMKIIDGYTKYPIRKFIDGRLPDSVVWRRNKMGWPSPWKRWIDCFDKQRIGIMLKEPRSAKYFNIPAVRKLWEQDPYHSAMVQFLNVEIFMRLFDAA